MSYHEPKKHIITRKGIEYKSPIHHQTAISNSYSSTLRQPISTPIKSTIIEGDSKISEIKFLTKEKILFINSAIEKQSKKYAEIEYVRRFVNINIRKRLDILIECTEEYYYLTKDVQLTSAYYLKNIIILQSLEDANHRTSILSTSIFLNENGYNTKKITKKCSILFKRRLLMYRQKEYYTTEPLPSRVLEFDDNTMENSELFEYCLNFIKSKIIK